MKWWGVPFLLVGLPLFLIGMSVDASGLIFDLSFVAGAILGVLGILFLFFLPYAGSHDEQRRTGRQDRAGIAVIVCVLALVISAVAMCSRFT